LAFSGVSAAHLRAFALVILTGFFFRVYQLPAIPSGLTWDEGAEGLEAARLFHGEFPVFFPEHGGHEPLLIYAQAAALKLFGWSPFALRLPTAFLSTLALAATFLVARRLFGFHTAWIATLLQAAALWQVAMSRMAIRPESLAVFGALCVYWLVRWLRGDPSWRCPVLCGLFLALAQYTYTPARFLPAVVGGAWLWALVRCSQARGLLLRQAGLCAGAAVALSTPLGAYFATHPEAFFERAGELSIFNPANGSALPSWLGAVKATLLMFSVAGEQGWDKNIAHQPLFDPVASVFFMVGLLMSVWNIRKPGYGLALWWLAVMAFPLTLTAKDLPDFGRVSGIAPAVFLFPAIAAAALLTRWPASRWAIGAGVLGVVAAGYWQYFAIWAGAPGREQVYRPAILAAAEAAVGRLTAVGGPARVYFGTEEPFDAVTDFVQAGFGIEHPDRAGQLVGYDARFTRVLPPAGSESYLIVPGLPAVGSLPPARTRASFQLGTALTVTGYDLPAAAAPGEPLQLQVVWRPGQPPRGTLTFFAHLLDYVQQPAGAEFDHNGFLPQSWRGGETVSSTFPLQVPATIQPGAYWVEFGAYDANGQRLRDGQANDRELLGPVVVAGPAPASARPIADFGGYAALTRSRLEHGSGSQVEIALTWVPEHTFDQDYSVFVHVLDASGKLVAQADGPPDDGRWPTRYWLPGTAVMDVHRLLLNGLPPGTYSVAAGLYQLSSGQRLPSSKPGPEPASALAGEFSWP
jgi:4-amino-4-deoxy-L-arabinose transferase-like glycosyltransferase